MSERQARIDALEKRLTELQWQLREQSSELQRLRLELLALQNEEEMEGPFSRHAPEAEEELQKQAAPEKVQERVWPEPLEYEPVASKPERDWERFIGENLIAKVGMLAVLVGIGIFLNYAIENEWLKPTPLSRMLSGTVAGLVLIGLSLYLKPRYRTYSALLAGGGIAVLYFTTFAAYSYYDLIGYGVAFVLMFLLTALTVAAALWYDLEIIALFGLVAAYAIPPLLSTAGGEMAVYLTYMTLLNAGVLFLSLRKSWLGLFWTAFIASWLLLTGWTISDIVAAHLNTVLIFGSLFFLLFYAAILIIRPSKDEQDFREVFLLLGNAVFYSLCSYTYLLEFSGWKGQLLFTLANALVHGGAALLIYSRWPDRKPLLLLTCALAVVYVTLAIPVAFKGRMLPIMWAVEMGVLYFIGQRQQIRLAQTLALFLLGPVVVSLVAGWFGYYSFFIITQFPQEVTHTFLVNPEFGTSVFVLGILGWMTFSHREDYRREDHIALQPYLIGTAFAILTFIIFFLEINRSLWVKEFHLLYTPEGIPEGMRMFRYSVVYAYSLAFGLGLISLLLQLFPKESLRRQLVMALGFILAALFLFINMPMLNELREIAFNGGPARYFWVRFAGFGLFAALCWRLHQALRQTKTADWHLPQLLLYVAGLVLLTNFLTTAMMAAFPDMAARSIYKGGYSILWGVFALFMLLMGLRSGQRTVRIVGMSLIGVVLCKIVFYDLAFLPALQKVMLFVAIGIVMLVVSFLYQRFGKTEEG